MPFFQNPFTAQFKGHWPLRTPDLGKTQSIILEGLGNPGRGDDMVRTYGTAPFDLSGNDTEGDPKRYLNIKFSMESSSFTKWNLMQYDLGTGSATTADQVATALNNNSNFSSWFTATVQNNVVIIRQLKAGRLKFFVVNGGAEEVLKFNYYAGVFELPTYFTRHVVGGTNTDCLHTLILLDDENNVDAAVIDSAVTANGDPLGLDSGAPKNDWQFLQGSCGNFVFKKQALDGSNRVTESIQYPAGSVAGDQAVKFVYTYTDGNTNPTNVFELPYILQSGDLIEP